MTTYITVAIPYVNAAPHVGYADELVIADIAARARRQSGEAVRFQGGTDDYSLKNVRAAAAAGEPVERYVRRHADRFADLARVLDVSFDDFVSTSADPRHRRAVERLWRACATNGDLYRKGYVGDYCVGCEEFVRLDDQVAGCCPEHLTPVERVAEENWFFRLSAYQDHIEVLITSGELEIHPAPFREEVLAFVRGGLEDISVSRSRRRAQGWGVPVPDDADGDAGQVIYVWFDALANYLSGLDFGDPDSADYRTWWLDADERIHVIGKGISRFHAVYWPAFLASAGQPAPTRIELHPYLTVDGAKLSKSWRLPVAAPDELVDRYGADALRWWFASATSPTVDTDFTEERLVAVANADLAGGVGNAVHRVATLARRWLPAGPPDGTWPIASTLGLELDVLDALRRFDLRGACRLIGDAVDALNRDVEVAAPWRLARSASPGAVDELTAVLGRQLATAQLIGRALRPISPALAERVLIAVGGGDDGAPMAPRLELPTRRLEAFSSEV